MSTTPTQVRLEHAGAAGQRRTYRSRTQVAQEEVRTSDSEEQPEQRSMQQAWSEALVRVRVLAVDDDGSRHVAHCLEPQEVGGDAAALGLHLSRHISYDHLDARGQVIDSTHQGAHRLYLLPDEPVAEGASWEATLPVLVPYLQRQVECLFRYQLTSLKQATRQDGQPRTVACVDFEAVPVGFGVELDEGATASFELAVGGLLEFAVEDGYALRLAMGVESRSQLANHHCRTLSRTDMQLVEE